MLGILFELMHKDKITARQISVYFEISRRTAYRYINALSISGVPVISRVGRNGGSFLLHRSFFPKYFFTPDELDTILHSLSHIPDTTHNKTLINKLLALKSPKE